MTPDPIHRFSITAGGYASRLTGEHRERLVAFAGSLEAVLQDAARRAAAITADPYLTPSGKAAKRAALAAEVGPKFAPARGALGRLSEEVATARRAAVPRLRDVQPPSDPLAYARQSEIRTLLRNMTGEHANLERQKVVDAALAAGDLEVLAAIRFDPGRALTGPLVPDEALERTITSIERRALFDAEGQTDVGPASTHLSGAQDLVAVVDGFLADLTATEPAA